jgi:hypothetical protein
MIWSIIPAEMIFSGAEKYESRHIFYRNRIIRTVDALNGQKKIAALISSDPLDFLNASWFPGKYIK